jgi:hypothetical protein
VDAFVWVGFLGGLFDGSRAHERCELRREREHGYEYDCESESEHEHEHEHEG